VGAPPKKPYEDFPLSPRKDGRWCKRVCGTLHYFAGTGQEALDEWNRVKDDHYAGRPPRIKEGSTDVAGLVNAFLRHKRRRQDSGELAPITWSGYKSVGKLLTEFDPCRAIARSAPLRRVLEGPDRSESGVAVLRFQADHLR
jgi:hypothetical protein